jgi:hypothetical protein
LELQVVSKSLSRRNYREIFLEETIMGSVGDIGFNAFDLFGPLLDFLDVQAAKGQPAKAPEGTTPADKESWGAD